ncbi:hypothetical protein [Bosea sp. CRIB-10]|uniref:hypothetical protein n=1 Tax=Bosea sp. CRIB-10 TaxID=378404 RepID=UPI000AA7B548|nr:hypothetical protein [Bosea sp. CRIB-10]
MLRRGTICAISFIARVWGFDADQQRHCGLSGITKKRRVACDKPEGGRLTQLLESRPNQAVTIAYDADGGVWKERLLSQAVERMARRLEQFRNSSNREIALGPCFIAISSREPVSTSLENALAKNGLMRQGLTLKGLRHARGVELAMAGASDAEIMAQTSMRPTRLWRSIAGRRSAVALPTTGRSGSTTSSTSRQAQSREPSMNGRL